MARGAGGHDGSMDAAGGAVDEEEGGVGTKEGSGLRLGSGYGILGVKEIVELGKLWEVVGEGGKAQQASKGGWGGRTTPVAWEVEGCHWGLRRARCQGLHQRRSCSGNTR